MPNPWNGKAVLQVFWWNCDDATYHFDWYTYLAKLCPRLASLGFDGIWIPPPVKDTDAQNNMGYTPFDYYDLGQKNQRGATGIRFGNQDALLRLVAVAHANGLEVYPDIVLDHCGGGNLDPSAPWPSTYTLFQPKGFGGVGTGRWPRNWLDFHYNPAHWHGTGEWPPSPNPRDDFGSDFCYQGRCSDSGNADSNCSSRRNARAWFTWFTRQTGVDGFRFDDVKGFPPEVIDDLLWNAMGDRVDYFCVGEYIPSNNSSEQDDWANGTNNRSGTFDYSFSDALQELATSNGYFDVGSLPSLQQRNRFKTVPFVNNHDTLDGHSRAYISPDDERAQLAYAVAITIDGSPQFFFPDLFSNYLDSAPADALCARPWLLNLLWCHQKLAFKSGDYFVRYQNSKQLLILERGARAIVAINNDGNAWHDAWISTAFPPNTQLHDYSGSRTDDIWTNQDGWVHIAVPPISYSVWGPAGVAGGCAPSPRRTVQQFEMDDDLGDSDPASLQYGGKAIPGNYRLAGAIWPAAGSQLNIFVYSDSPQGVDLKIISQGDGMVHSGSGQASPDAPFSITFTVTKEGRHVLQAKLSSPVAPAARLYIKVDYLGPTISTLF